jgi:pyrroloquinoline-quinone synthase
MEKKQHWAWPAFSQGVVPKRLLHIHLEHEYAVYVRDFPVLVARAYVQCPVAEVRRELIENVYEEETGGILAGRPHPELFLDYPRGLGMDLSRFDHVPLLPKAQQFRDYLDHATTQLGWSVAAAVSTLFLEGTAYERGELDESAPKRPLPALEEHPLVKHYGLPLDKLRLAKAHRAVEGEHRKAAWRVLLDFVPESEHAPVSQALETGVALWLGYRDDVAFACGLSRNADGSARLRDDA